MTTKTETKQFQYEIQAYQEDCVNNIISLFESLRQKLDFAEVFTAHHQKHKYNFPRCRRFIIGGLLGKSKKNR